MRTKKINPYYVGYNIMIEGLKQEDVYEGLANALRLAEEYLNSENITIYEYKDDCFRKMVYSDEENKNSKNVSFIINNNFDLIENKEPFTLELNSKKISKLTIIPINIKNRKYVISIENHNLDSNLLEEFEEILTNSFKVILDRISSYLEIKRISEKDSLTGLSNRTAYSDKIFEKNEHKEHITYAIIDLFRLKFVNDVIGHSAGDLYIQNVANILTKYFPPKEKIIGENGEIEKVNTGDSVYRIGGDEFVVLSEAKSEEEVKRIIELAALEVEELELGSNELFNMAINYGIAERKDLEDVESLYLMADKRLSEDKKEMYKKLGIERRR